jgi:hypothetical protein
MKLFPTSLKQLLLFSLVCLMKEKESSLPGWNLLKWDYGGDRRIAALLGLDEKQ